MTFISYLAIKAGSKVEAIARLHNGEGEFTIGHRFIVTSTDIEYGEILFNLEDSEGNKVHLVQGRKILLIE